MFYISERIRYGSVPLETVLTELSQTDEFCTFSLLPSSGSGGDVRSRWIETITERGKDNALLADDEMILCGFARDLGKSDASGQVRFCEEYRERIQRQLEEARQAVNTAGRIWLTLGVCGGIATALLLW